MGRLDGKIALITGGNSGIGFATAKLFVAEGAKVVITGKRDSAVSEAAVQLGDNVWGITADITSQSDLDSLFATIERRYPSLDIVVASAGVLAIAPLTDASIDHFEHEFGVNVRGTFFTVQKAIRLMRNGGSVVLVSSVANSTGYPGYSIYSATKAAVRSFARTWTSELRDRNIRVNTLSPGPTDTPMSEKTGLPPEQLAAVVAAMASQIPLGRIANAQEIARAALFLASEESSFVCGIDLPVDGGLAQV